MQMQGMGGGAELLIITGQYKSNLPYYKTTRLGFKSV